MNIILNVGIILNLDMILNIKILNVIIVQKKN